MEFFDPVDALADGIPEQVYVGARVGAERSRRRAEDLAQERVVVRCSRRNFPTPPAKACLGSALQTKVNAMQTVFSHIVQKRLSQESENVATEALAFMLAREATRNGLMKLLRGIVPQLPHLWFRTQETEENNRPDMWGCDEAGQPHVFVENKFWAGLTENQPVSYLRLLAKQPHLTVLLMIAPQAREQALARELKRKLDEAGISAAEQPSTAGLACSFITNDGPILALSSWEKLFSFLEPELTDDPAARSDLLQLRALCKAADNDAFIPFSSGQITDQRAPAFILQLSSIVQAAAALAVKEETFDCKRLNPQADFTRIGRYAYLGMRRQVGIWFGVHFGLWKAHGTTPLWVIFNSDFGRPDEVRPLLEPWAAKTGVLVVHQPNGIAVSIELKVREEKDAVMRAIVDQLAQIVQAVAPIRPKPTPPPPSVGE